MTRFSRYEITGELGRGAMGIVYRAQDPAIGRTVAIKTIRLSDISDPEEMQRLKERLFREARSAGMLSHPHIVTIYDIGQEGQTAFIAMEFVNGPTLETLMKRNEAPDKKLLLKVLRDTASALDYAHQKGIIHRDVKPANIMIQDDGAVKITDFGVAKILSQQITQADVVLGTPSYMSPEQIEAKGLDGRSDQFALAVIAYELLTGEKAFSGDSLPALMFKIVKEDPVPARQLNSTLAPEVERVLQRGLAKQPAERFATCLDFASALASSLQENPDWQPMARGSVTSAPTVVTTPEPSRKIAGDSASGLPTVEVEQIEPPAVPPAPPPAAAPVPLPPSRRRVEAEAGQTPAVEPPPFAAVAQPTSSPARIAVLALAAVAVLVVAGFLVFKQIWQPGASEVKTAAGSPAPRTEPPPAVTPANEPPPKPPDSVPQPLKPPETLKPKVPQSTAISITTEPEGASVAIEGNPVCTTPCPLDLPAGRYVLVFSLAGHRPLTRIMNVPQETALTVRLDKVAGMLTVRSNPPDAAILVNGQQQPQRTPAMLSLAPGKYKLVLRKAGLPDYEEEVEVKDQVTTDLNINWAQNR